MWFTGSFTGSRTLVPSSFSGVNGKPLTKDQLKQIEESVNALTGLGPFKKSTKTEPTPAQLKKIQVAFRQAENRRAHNKSKVGKLEDEITLRLLADPKSQSNLGLFWDKITSIRNAVKSHTSKQGESLGYYDDLIYEYVTKHTLLQLEFTNLARAKGMTFKKICPYAARAFADAIERSDFDFFKRVGNVLRTMQRKERFWLDDEYSQLQVFLMNHWVKEFDGVPPLYNQSISALLKLCQANLNNERLTWEAVEKTRKRLGLLVFRKTSSRKGKNRS